MQSSRTIIALIMVIVLMTSVISMFGLMHLFKDPNDQYRVDHDYEVSGTYSAYSVTGNGHSQYINENSSYVYRVTTTYSFFDGEKQTTAETPVFTVICDSNKKVDESLYTYMGTKDADGSTYNLWKYTKDSLSVIFTIDSNLCIHEYILTDDTLSLNATLK